MEKIRVNLTCSPRNRGEYGTTDHVKLVNGCHNLGDSEAAHEHDVLACLPTAIEARLKLTGRGVHNKERAVRLRGTGDHVWNEVPMSGSVEYGDIPVRCRERLHGNVHRYTPLKSLQIQSPARGHQKPRDPTSESFVLTARAPRSCRQIATPS